MSRYPDVIFPLPLSRAIAALNAASEKAKDELALAYPIGSQVLVHHTRGSFLAEIVNNRGTAWRLYTGELSVRNLATGKDSRPHSTRVEIVWKPSA